MSEFKREKVGFFRKLLIKFGKKLVWWRAAKANKFLFNSTALFFYDMYPEIMNADFTKINDEWFLIGTRMGNTIVDDIFDLLEMMISKKVEDLTYVIEAAWYVHLYQGLKTIEYFPADENGVEKIVWGWDNCILCSNIHNVFDPKISKNINIEGVIAGLYQTGLQMIEEHVGNSYEINVRTTKSKLWGNPYCELTAIFKPIKDNSI